MQTQTEPRVQVNFVWDENGDFSGVSVGVHPKGGIVASAGAGEIVTTSNTLAYDDLTGLQPEAEKIQWGFVGIDADPA